MASGLFFDPLVALRVAPLVSSTCTLLYAWDQHFFLGVLNRPDHRARSRPLLSSYFDTIFYRGVAFVVSVLGVTTWSSIANLCAHRADLHARQSFRWYIAGAVLSASHLLFVPKIASSCKALIYPDSNPGEDVNVVLDGWLSINWVRMVTVDLAAWAVTVIAVTKTLRAD